MSFGASIRAIAVVIGVLGLTGISSAAPVSYTFKLNIDSVSYGVLGQAGCQERLGLSRMPQFGCNWLANEELSGAFTLGMDVDGLSDGIYSYIPLLAWRVQIGGVDWEFSNPSPVSAFSGFRDGAYCGADGVGLGGLNPGLRLEGGKVVGFCGGVYGTGDTPFIDFDYLYGNGQFSAFDDVTLLQGSYQISVVPEPASLDLALLACAMGVAAARTSERLRRGAYGRRVGTSRAPLTGGDFGQQLRANLYPCGGAGRKPHCLSDGGLVTARLKPVAARVAQRPAITAR